MPIGAISARERMQNYLLYGDETPAERAARLRQQAADARPDTLSAQQARLRVRRTQPDDWSAPAPPVAHDVRQQVYLPPRGALAMQALQAILEGGRR